MFNAERVFKFWKSVSRLAIPAIVIVGLAVVTELLTQLLAQSVIRLDSNFLLESGLNIIFFVGFYLVVLLGTMVLAGRFVAATYGLGGLREGVSALIRLLFGKLGFGPIVTVSGGQITSGQDTVVTKMGGPAGLVIHKDSAVVLEKRGKFTRIEGPGLPVLEPFEKVYDTIDLRPKRWVLAVNAMTKEGIPVKWDVEIRYQIDSGNQEPTEDHPYPFSEEAVFKAATGKWRREKERVQEMDWEGWIVISQTEGSLRAIIARRHLDELIGFSKEDSLGVREKVQQELTNIIGEAAPKVGAKLLDIQLQSLKVEDKVTEQWIKAWQAQWQSWSTRQLATREAMHIQEYEKAKAEAHILPLNKLTEELQKLDHADQAVILMRLASVMDQGTMGMASRVFFPGQAVDTIEHITQILGRGINEEEGEDNSPYFYALPPEEESRTQAVPREIMRVLPLFDEVAAGQEKPVLDDIKGYVQQFSDDAFELDDQIYTAHSLRGQSLPVLSPKLNYVAIKISGDSMDQAGISSGDHVILQRKGEGVLVPATGDIVTVVFRDQDNKATLKRITIGKEAVTLKPESSNVEHKVRTLPFDVFRSDPPSVEITGIAVAVLKLNGSEA